ncbi:hypothetical protein ACIG56_26640 [Nocardia fusca]|uniref:hypothetical protein n=1 Tax=Nocardia fusca TaxID=941183 RepID=UPI0037CB96F5
MTSDEQIDCPKLQKSNFGKSTWITASVFMFVNIVPITVLPILAIPSTVLYLTEIILAAVLCAFPGNPRQIGVGLIAAIATTALLFMLMVFVTWIA